MNNNEWTKSTKKPEESGFYIIHVLENISSNYCGSGVFGLY